VWPESPAPFFEQDPRFQQSMADVARAEQAPLVVNGVGADFDKENNRWRDYVSAMAFDAGGRELGRYDKIHLVPWGEYVPFQKFFFFVRKLTGKVASFTPGEDRKVFHLTDGHGAMHRYGIFICYEAVFADEIRQFAKNGAEVFVTGSDDGWYGDTSAPWQLLNMARMRHQRRRHSGDRSLRPCAAKHSAAQGRCAAGRVRLRRRPHLLHSARRRVCVAVCGDSGWRGLVGGI